ncbi:MAG: hypothetical protein EA361_14510 [Bacteroidetes bacterium]|nr:MAG: hypothetical protein EA361_14510 [Bacteroidota bacterium]
MQLVIFTVIISLGMATSIAQEKYQVAGKQTIAFTKQDRSIVGDVEGHVLSLAQSEGVNPSTGATDFMHGAQVINFITSDLINYSGPIHGYSKMTKKGDSVFVKFEGTLTTTLSADGTPVTIAEAKWNWIKGTGQFENIQGNGTMKVQYIATNIYTAEWEGDYWIKK